MTEPRRSGDWLVLARRALAFVRPFRASSLLILALAVGAAALGALEPLLLKYIFDSVSLAEVR